MDSTFGGVLIFSLLQNTHVELWLLLSTGTVTKGH